MKPNPSTGGTNARTESENAHCPNSCPDRQPGDGESWDGSGNIRPVPPGVGDYADEVVDDA